MDPTGDWQAARQAKSLTGSFSSAWSVDHREARDRPIVVDEAHTSSLRGSSLYNPIDPPHARTPFDPPVVDTVGAKAPKFSFYSKYGSEFGTPEHAEKVQGAQSGAAPGEGTWGVIVSEVDGRLICNPETCAPSSTTKNHEAVLSAFGKQVLSTRLTEGCTKLQEADTCLDDRGSELLAAAVDRRKEPGPADYTIETTIGAKSGARCSSFGVRHQAFQRKGPAANAYRYESRVTRFGERVSESTVGTDIRGQSTFNSLVPRAPRAVLHSREPKQERKPPPEAAVVSRGESYRSDPSRWTRRVRAEVKDAQPSLPPMYSSFSSNQIRSGNRSNKGASMKFMHVNRSRTTGTPEE